MIIEPMNEDGGPTLPKTVAIAFVTAMFTAIATKTGEWAVETLKKRLETKTEADK